MKKLLIFIMAICLVGCSNVSVEEEAVSKMIFAMDTVMDIKIYGEQDYLIIAENRIMELENLLSVTNESSDIYMLNSKDSEFYKVSEDTLGMISDAIELCEKTEGALDISIYPILKEWGFTTSEYQIPTDYEINNLLQYVDFAQIEISDDNLIKIPDNMNIDLGSVAKGATSDILVDIFKDLGVTSGLINLGGNVHTIGTKPNGNGKSN